MKKVVVSILMFLLLTTTVLAKGNEDITVKLNGKNLYFSDQKPVILDGRTLVPVRTIFEELGFEVTWDATEQKVLGVKTDEKIEMYINNKTVKVNDQEITLDVPAQIINNRTMVPLRFIAESCDKNVNWQEENNIVWILDKDAYKLVENEGRFTYLDKDGKELDLKSFDKKTEDVTLATDMEAEITEDMATYSITNVDVDGDGISDDMKVVFYKADYIYDLNCDDSWFPFYIKYGKIIVNGKETKIEYDGFDAVAYIDSVSIIDIDNRDKCKKISLNFSTTGLDYSCLYRYNGKKEGRISSSNASFDGLGKIISVNDYSKIGGILIGIYDKGKHNSIDYSSALNKKYSVTGLATYSFDDDYERRYVTNEEISDMGEVRELKEIILKDIYDYNTFEIKILDGKRGYLSYQIAG